MNYQEYLKSARWRKLTDERKALDGYRCRVCNGGANLQVHHRTYQNIGNETLDDLTTLCAECHAIFSKFGKAQRWYLAPVEYDPPAFERLLEIEGAIR
jgi:5-methylcytosine-specific restriction endonuclease McrA